MKITKQRLKEIIKEELENSQNEGLFSKLKAKMGFGGSKKWEPLTDNFQKEYRQLYRTHFDMKTGAEIAEVVQQMEMAYKRYKGALDDEALSKEMLGGTESVVRGYLGDLGRIAKRAEDMGAREAVEAANKAREEAEEQEEFNRKRRDSKAREDYAQRKQGGNRMSNAYDKPRHDYTKDRPNAYMGGGGEYQQARSPRDLNEKDYMTRMEEGKITKRDLKVLIAEELTAVEKGKKAELEKELDGLKHK